VTPSIDLPASLWLDIRNHAKVEELLRWGLLKAEDGWRAAGALPTDLPAYTHQVVAGLVGEWAFSLWWYGDEQPFWDKAATEGPDHGSDLATGEPIDVKTTRQRDPAGDPLELHLMIPKREMRQGQIHVFAVIASDAKTCRLMGWTRSMDHLGQAMHYSRSGVIQAHVPAWKLHSMHTLKESWA
jgi:hypothetical protein